MLAKELPRRVIVSRGVGQERRGQWQAAVFALAAVLAAYFTIEVCTTNTHTHKYTEGAMYKKFMGLSR